MLSQKIFKNTCGETDYGWVLPQVAINIFSNLLSHHRRNHEHVILDQTDRAVGIKMYKDSGQPDWMREKI